MSSYRIKLSSSKDGSVVFLNETSPDILDVFNAPEDSKVADTSKSSIPLIRRGARDFADEIGEGMINMLENFAAQTPPTKPLLGQLWFQKTPTGNHLRYCMNPTGTTEAQTWGYVGTSISAPNANPLKLIMTGDVKPNSTSPAGAVFTLNSSNELFVDFRLSEIHTVAAAAAEYDRPKIKIDRSGRIVSITQGDPIQTGVNWATATPTQVNVDRNLNTSGKIMEGGNALLPTGSIIMWYGSVASVPLGWRLCNGQNGTPDLRDRFVVGAGGGFAAGQRGGSSALNVNGTTSVSGAHDHPVSITSAGAHTHTGATSETALTIAQMPTHQHAIGWGESNRHPYPPYGALGGQNGPRTTIGSRDTDFDNYNYLSEPVGGGLGHSHAIPSDGNHTHSGTASSSGAHSHTMSVSGDLMPPYYALCYIMKA